jgi:hypothetical protein
MWNILKSLLAPRHPDSPVDHYVIGRRFDPGAPGEVFVSDLGLPLMIFHGRARVAGSLSKFQTPQVWFPQQQGIQGIGGVQAGAFVGQRLFDPAEIDPGAGA